MRHLNLEMERLEQRIAPGGLCGIGLGLGLGVGAVNDGDVLNDECGLCLGGNRESEDYEGRRREPRWPPGATRTRPMVSRLRRNQEECLLLFEWPLPLPLPLPDPSPDALAPAPARG